jgi:predicted Zn-dependent protease
MKLPFNVAGIFFFCLLIIGSGLLFSGCTRVPITGRSQLALINNEELIPFTDSVFREVVQKLPTSKDTLLVRRVNRVGIRVIQAVDSFLISQGEGELARRYRWQIKVIADTSVANALCFPGGKILVFTGLLPLCDTDAELAGILGHEIGHAIANHSAESISKWMLRLSGAMAVATTTAVVPGVSVESGLEAYEALTSIGGAAHSRKQEREADRLGIIFMAMAGYAPEQYAQLWENMQIKNPESNLSLSRTHPTYADRRQQAQKNLAEARRYLPQNRRN